MASRLPLTLLRYWFYRHACYYVTYAFAIRFLSLFSDAGHCWFLLSFFFFFTLISIIIIIISYILLYQLSFFFDWFSLILIFFSHICWFSSSLLCFSLSLFDRCLVLLQLIAAFSYGFFAAAMLFIGATRSMLSPAACHYSWYFLYYILFIFIYIFIWLLPYYYHDYCSLLFSRYSDISLLHYFVYYFFFFFFFFFSFLYFHYFLFISYSSSFYATIDFIRFHFFHFSLIMMRDISFLLFFIAAIDFFIICRISYYYFRAIIFMPLIGHAFIFIFFFFFFCLYLFSLRDFREIFFHIFLFILSHVIIRRFLLRCFLYYC